MTKNDQNLIAVHDALLAVGATRAFFHTKAGWVRYANPALHENMFTCSPANGPVLAFQIIGRPKPKTPR